MHQLGIWTSIKTLMMWKKYVKNKWVEIFAPELRPSDHMPPHECMVSLKV